MDSIEENFVFGTLFVMLLIVFANFVSRYVFHSSLPWGEEAARYLMIWATFVAASLGVKKGAHITLDILIVYMSEKNQKRLRAISYILSMIYCVLILFIGVPFIFNLIEKGQVSPALQIPVHFIYASIVIGTILMLIRYILLFVSDIIRSEGVEKPEIFAE